MMWVISGPTSVGKSTFIKSPRCSEITGLSSQTPIVWAAKHDSLDNFHETNLFYHYNILRPLHLKHRIRRMRGAKQPTVDTDTSFNQDLPWNDLANREVAKKAIVLVTSKQTIAQRIMQRQTVENSALIRFKKNHYPVEHWLNLLEQADLVAVYRAWCRELQSRSIPYTLVDSGDSNYPIIESDDQLPSIVNGINSEYTKAQIEEILRKRKFAYHRVELPFGLHTRGADRSETRDLILPDSMMGKTVLDVGSALGYFCFEAEARGAKRVIGVEMKEDRFYDAMLLKKIKGSGVDFLRRDIVLDPLEESFDYVLLLNVIHHLAEPFRVMRQLASIARERLIIEFPTFSDPKFRKTANIEDPSLYNGLPLVGVSSVTEAGQTFVFTPKAIRRALLNHDRLFRKIEILRSPMPGRRIAICYK